MDMLHLYIDTNVYLTFFHLTNEDLEELKKLFVLIAKSRDVTLHLPQQTIDEFFRNREVKIADALRLFKEEKLNNQFPQMCKQYPEYEDIRKAIIAFDAGKKILLERLEGDVLSNKLAADTVTAQLFDNASVYSTDDNVLGNAFARAHKGNPPGKDGSHGDAINWETLLANVPDEQDLHFVSDDKDYYSAIDPSRFSSFLMNEWRTRKGTNIIAYRRISQFFKDRFPQIKIASEFEKDLLIAQLTSSGSFASSRAILRKIVQHDEFSVSQLNDLVRAFVENEQIYWIRKDEDMEQMISGIVTGNRDKIDGPWLEEFDNLYSDEEGAPDS
jgi:hypothetical protein